MISVCSTALVTTRSHNSGFAGSYVIGPTRDNALSTVQFISLASQISKFDDRDAPIPSATTEPSPMKARDPKRPPALRAAIMKSGRWIEQIIAHCPVSTAPLAFWIRAREAAIKNLGTGHLQLCVHFAPLDAAPALRPFRNLTAVANSPRAARISAPSRHCERPLVDRPEDLVGRRGDAECFAGPLEPAWDKT